MTQVGVELTRLRARRASWLLALLAVVISAGFALKVGHDTRPISADERATAVAQAKNAADSDNVRRVVKSCQADPGSFLGKGRSKAECARILAPKASDFLTRKPLHLSSVMRHNGLNAALLTLVLVALIAAVFAGADWASGSMGAQLLAQPRRGRVWVAKAVAAAVSGLVVAAASMAVLWIPLRLLASARGLEVHVGGELAWYVVRVLALAALVGVLSYALTMLFRSTVVTIGLLFGVVLAAEILLGLLPIPSNGWLSPSNNVFAWVLGHTTYNDPSVSCAGAACDRLRTLDMWPAAALMVGGVAVLCAASWAAFGRRDLP